MTPEQDKMLATAVEYFVDTNRVGKSAVVTLSAFGFSKLHAAPFKLREVEGVFTTYAKFLTAVNQNIKGSKTSGRSPRPVVGIFTRAEQLKRNVAKAATRELLQLTTELATAEEYFTSLEKDKEDLEAKIKAGMGAIEELTASIAAKSPKPEVKPEAKPEAKKVAK